jgi:D-sedoheptulose 7-phosphate isomerase
VRQPFSARGREHLAALGAPLAALEYELPRMGAWGRRLARLLLGGGRLLAVGNGGSAALAEHLTAELVGRYREERVPLSAIALHSDGSSLSAIGNDYGAEEAFARQVRAHGRPGDVLVALSTSGRSPNVIAAARMGRAGGLLTLGFTGPAPNLLADLCDDALCVDGATTATVQEVHQVAVHLLCEAIDQVILAPLAQEAAPRSLRAAS